MVIKFDVFFYLFKYNLCFLFIYFIELYKLVILTLFPEEAWACNKIIRVKNAANCGPASVHFAGK